MLEWIKNIGVALTIVEAIKTTVEMFVREAETAGFGPEKKAAVMKGVKNTLKELEVAEAVQFLVLAIFSGLIEVYVMFLNISKFFKHTDE